VCVKPTKIIYFCFVRTVGRCLTPYPLFKKSGSKTFMGKLCFPFLF